MQADADLVRNDLYAPPLFIAEFLFFEDQKNFTGVEF